MNLQILDLINFEMTIIVATSRQEYTLKLSVEILSKIVLDCYLMDWKKSSTVF